MLVIWTIVGYAGTITGTFEKWDWRPIAEFHGEAGKSGPRVKTALEMCEEAARELKVHIHKCIRTR